MDAGGSVARSDCQSLPLTDGAPADLLRCGRKVPAKRVVCAETCHTNGNCQLIVRLFRTS